MEEQASFFHPQIQNSMKFFSFTFPVLSLLLSAISQAAITWDPQTNAPYTAGNTLTFQNSDLGSAWYGIAVDATSSVDGDSFDTFAGDSAFQFRTADAIPDGGMVTFTFNFNMQMQSGPKWNGSTPPARVGAGGRFVPRVIGGVPVDLGASTLAVTTSGGPTTLQSQFGTSPLVGAQDHNNPGTLIYNDNVTDPSLNLFDDTSAFGSFSGGGNTANFDVGSDTAQLGAAFADFDRSISANDFSFQSVTYKWTNNSGAEIARRAQFLFTFEGVNVVAQTALAVPEPSRLLLLCGGALVVCGRRRR